MSKKKTKTPTVPLPTFVTPGMRQEARLLLNDEDAQDFVQDCWRLHVGESTAFSDFGPVELGCIRFLTGALHLLEIIAGDEDAEAVTA